MIKKITFASWKGGTGKTNLSAAVAISLAYMGYRILLADIDSNITLSRIFKRENEDYTTKNLLNGERVKPVKTPIDNIDIIPSDIRISKMANLGEKELNHRLKKIDLDSYDFLFIDPPGTMNDLTRNAMVAADKIIITGMLSTVDFRCIELVFEELDMMELTHKDIFVQMTNSQPDKNEPGVLEMYQDVYGDHIANPPISAMKSMKRLTANIEEYRLRGAQKKQIDDFVKSVIL